MIEGIILITVTTEQYQGQESFRITTPDCTYLYHREGCGFAALFDRDGNDWISYRPTGGEYGHYRGIPNMGYNAFGHPGYEYGARSSLEIATEKHVRIASSSTEDDWRCHWDIYPEGAVQTIETVSKPYWWLYEGTPGGRFQPDANYRLLPDGCRLSCNERDYRPAIDVRWIGFGDPGCGRLLLLGAHTAEVVTDAFWPMGGEGGMTVFGFGREDRDGLHPHLTVTPARFSFALLESEDVADTQDRFERLHALIERGV